MTTRALTLGGAIVLAIALAPASWNRASWDATFWDARLDAHPRISTTLTWHADIAPLFERHCASCHADAASPERATASASRMSMPLAAYADVRPWVRAIREEVLERRMPPRVGRPGMDSGIDDHVLSPMARDLIVGWIDGGSPEGKPGAERTATFWCHMHPEVRDDRAGACPICGMALAQFLPDLAKRYGWSIEPTTDAKGRVRRLELAVMERGPSTGTAPATTAATNGTAAPVRAFERVHDYPMHLFIVSEDFQRFDHVHPQLDADGRFAVAWQPPSAVGNRGRHRGDRYWLYGDFLPVGGPPQLLQRMIQVGPPPPSRSIAPAPAVPTLAAALAAAAGGLSATLTTPAAASAAAASRPSATPRAGDVQRIAIALTETASGKPVADLEPYLGAWGHLFVVHEGRDEALHAHPETTGTTAGGPTIAFDVLFPRAGTYYLWAQVQRHRAIVTLPFRIQVVPRA